MGGEQWRTVGRRVIARQMSFDFRDDWRNNRIVSGNLRQLQLDACASRLRGFDEHEVMLEANDCHGAGNGRGGKREL